MAISTQVAAAYQTCVFTAFSLVPTNCLMRRCCLIHLKNGSPCQRLLHSVAIVSAGSVVLLIRKTQKDECFARLRVFEADMPQMIWTVLGRIETIEHHPLIADHAGIALRRRGVPAPA